MAKKENVKNNTEEKYIIKNVYDDNGETFETVLKNVILSAYSCIISKNNIKYF